MRADPNPSLSLAPDVRLQAQLDAEDPNPSALLSEALSSWLARRRLDALPRAYAELEMIEAGARGLGVRPEG